MRVGDSLASFPGAIGMMSFEPTVTSSPFEVVGLFYHTGRSMVLVGDRAASDSPYSTL